MKLLPSGSTRTDSRFPYPPLFRSPEYLRLLVLHARRYPGGPCGLHRRRTRRRLQPVDRRLQPPRLGQRILERGVRDICIGIQHRRLVGSLVRCRGRYGGTRRCENRRGGEGGEHVSHGPARLLGVGGRTIPTLRIALNRLRRTADRSEEHTSELQSLMRISYAVFCLKKKKKQTMRTNKQCK